MASNKIVDIPASSAKAFELEKGSQLKIVDMEGQQIGDFVAFMLLREHTVGEEGARENIDAHYIGKLLSNNWGFYHTVTTNLGKLRDALTAYPQLMEQDQVDLLGKIGKLLEIIEETPKPLSWRARARIGTRARWYTTVDSLS